MTTTVTCTFNGCDIEAKARNISASSIAKLIDNAIDISDEHACKPGYTSLYEHITFMPSCKMLCYHRKLITSSGIPVHIRFTITASRTSLYKAIKHFKYLGIMQVL